MKIIFYSNYEKKLKEYKWNEYNILTNLLNNNIILPKINQNKYITENYLNNLKKKISNLKNYLPLYNIITRDLQLISKDNIYNKVKLENYRLPDEYIIKNFENYINENNKKLNINEKKYYDNIKNKIKLLKFFNLDILKQSYINMIYNDNIGKNFTTFQKISYLPFIKDSKAYYDKNELINMGLNLKLINDIKNIDLYKLYLQIIKFDFDSKLLLENLYHINSKNGFNIIQFYTFHGSYYMNYYLRNNDTIKDIFLEKLISYLWKIILSAPKIKTNKLLYRFVDNDSFLENLNINDYYIDKGFISTTRNQFYDIESETFGSILLKINIPINSNSCLCVETMSLFPNEEEVILPPNSKLKLINKDLNVEYNHINKNSINKITKKYEFIFEGSSFTSKFFKTGKENIPEFNFFKKYIKGKTITKKIENFYNIVKKKNSNNKFYIVINNQKILFYCDFYDSSDIYQKFYYYKKKKGFYIYSLNDKGQYNYFIEINNQLYVNYFMNYTNSNININTETLLDVISNIGYGFNVKNAILNNTYKLTKDFIKNIKSNDIFINTSYIKNYNYNLYYFFKNNSLFFDSKYIVNNFNLFYLHLLKKINIESIFKEDDKSNLFYIFKNYYKDKNNLGDFYLYILENYFYYTNELELKLEHIFKKYNQRFEFNYSFDIYLYILEGKNINLIPSYKTFIEDNDYNELYKKNYIKKLKSIQY